MLVITAERRSTETKAKHIRKAGKTPANLYGSGIKDSLPLQLAQGEVMKLQKLKSVDVVVTLDIENEKTVALLREISTNPLRTQVENICFQKLVDDEMVSSTAKILLVNTEIPLAQVKQEVYDLPYKSLGSNLVEEITIDLKGRRIGDMIRVMDLDIAKNENIELMMEPDRVVVTIAEKGKAAKRPEETEETPA